MDRRRFLQNIAAGTVALDRLARATIGGESNRAVEVNTPQQTGVPTSTDGFSEICQFTRAGTKLRVYEDFRRRDGSIVFISTNGETRELIKNTGASVVEVSADVGFALK